MKVISRSIMITVALVAAGPVLSQTPGDSPRRVGKMIRPPEVEYFLRGTLAADSLLWRGQMDVVFRNVGRDSIESLTLVLPSRASSPRLLEFDLPLDSVRFHNAPVECRRDGERLHISPPPIEPQGIAVVSMSFRARWQKPDWRRFDDALVIQNWYPRLVQPNGTGEVQFSTRANVNGHLFVDTSWVLTAPAELTNERTLFGIPLAFGDGVQSDILRLQIKTPDGRTVGMMYVGGKRPYQLTAERVDQMPLVLLRKPRLDRITLAPTIIDLYRPRPNLSGDSSITAFVQYFANSLQDRLGPCPLEKLAMAISSTVDDDIAANGGLTVLQADSSTLIYRLAETIARAWTAPFSWVGRRSCRLERGLSVWLTLAALVDDPNAAAWQREILAGYEILMKRDQSEVTYERAVRTPAMLQFLLSQTNENLYWDVLSARTRKRATDTGSAGSVADAMIENLSPGQAQFFWSLDTLSTIPDLAISSVRNRDSTRQKQVYTRMAGGLEAPIRAELLYRLARGEISVETCLVGTPVTIALLQERKGLLSIRLDPNGLIPDANRANNSSDLSTVGVGPKRFAEQYPPYRFLRRPWGLR